MAKLRSQQLNPNLTGSFNLSGSFIVTGSLHSTNSVADSGSLASRISIVEGNIGAQDLNTYATPTFAGLNLTDNTSITGSLTVSENISGSATSTASFAHTKIEDTFLLPVGTTAQRGTYSGSIRYSTTLSTFEGYDGANWGSLGGVIDVDQDTKITAETSAGADNDELQFTTAGTLQWTVGADGSMTGSLGNHVSGSSTSTGSFGRLEVAGAVNASGNVRVPRLEIDGATDYIDQALGNLFIVTTGDIAAQPGTGKALKVTGGIEATSHITASGDVYVSGNVSGSATSTGSFGRVETSEFSTSGTSTFSGTNIFTGNVGINSSNPTRALDVVGDIKATGDIIAENYIVSSSVVHLTQSFSSGSTIFGDTADDVHEFIGDTVSGSATSTGSFGKLAMGTDAEIYYEGDEFVINQGRNASTIFRNRGTQALRVDGGAKVGIGPDIVTPSQMLHIKTTGTTDAAITLEGPNSTWTVGNDYSDGGNFTLSNNSTVGTSVAFAIGANSLIMIGGDISGSASSTGSFGTLRIDGGVVDFDNANNTFIGKNSKSSVIDGADSNVIIGTDAGDALTSGDDNVFIGYAAGGVTTTGGKNISIGAGAGDNVNGSSNISIGFNTGGSGGLLNVLIGTNVGRLISTGNGTIGIGHETLYMLTEGQQNTTVGYDALRFEAKGDYSTAVGYEALRMQTGTDGTVGSTAIGYRAGYDATSGINGTFLGASTNPSSGSSNNEIVIGYGVTGLGDNQTVIGNSSQTHVVFGGDALISGSAKSTGSFGKLEVGSQIRLIEGADSFINGGDFGIGTSTPVARLEIEDDGTSNSMLLKLTVDDTNVYGMVFGNDTFSTTDTDGGQHILSNDGAYIIRTIGSSTSTRIGAGTAWNDYKYLEIDYDSDTAEFTTTKISGSSTSTASFGHFVGDGSGLENVFEGTAPSASISTRLTNTEATASSFIDGTAVLVSGSATSTGSFGRLEADVVEAKQFVVSSSVTNIVTIDVSGSTMFGDTGDDTHRFTGSVHIQSGSLAGEMHIVTNTDRMFVGRYGGGIPISGSITASRYATGSDGSIIDIGFTAVDDDGNTVLTTTGDGVHVNDRNYWYNSEHYRVGSNHQYLSYDTSNVAVKGQLIVTTGSYDGEMYINTGTSGSMGRMFIGKYTGGLPASGSDTVSRYVTGSDGSITDVGFTTVDEDGNTVLLTTGDGIHVDDNNYWYTTGNFKIGSSTNYFNWDNTALSFTGPLTASGDIMPSAHNLYDLGSDDIRWANIYTADLQLSNERATPNEVDGTTGSWTIQEGEDDLYLLNRNNGKKYRFKLEEIK